MAFEKLYWVFLQVGLCCLLALAHSGAQSVLRSADSPPTKTADDSGIPFRLAGGQNPLILLPVQANRRGPYEFILDTGATISLVTPELARELGLTTTGIHQGTGIGGNIQLAMSRVDSLAVGSAQINDMQVAITEDLHRIGQIIGAKVDGDIGYPFLKHFRLALDYPAQRLYLTAGAAPVAGRDAAVRFELGPKKPLILAPVHINGRGPFRFVVDTGASQMALSSALADQLGVKTAPSGQGFGAAGSIPVRQGYVDSVAIGAARLERLAVTVADEMFARIGQAMGTSFDGIVGYNFLREFRVTIDYPASSLRLDPPKR